MLRASLLLFCILLATASAAAQDTGMANALRDIARAQERQAESLRRIQRIEENRHRDDDRAARNAARDARSARRFDRQ